MSRQLTFEDLTGGINNVDTKGNLNSSEKKTQSPDMVNVEYFKLGGIKSMNGNTRVGDIQSGSIIGGWEYTRGSNKYMMIGTSDENNSYVKKYNPSTEVFDTIHTFDNPSNRISFCNINNGVVATNGIDNLMFYDESDRTFSGVLTVTNGSNVVTGVGTLFTTELQVGNKLRIENCEGTYTVSSITDDTTLELSENIVVGNGRYYYGWTGSEQQYVVTKSRNDLNISINSASEQGLNEEATLTYVGNGVFKDYFRQYISSSEKAFYKRIKNGKLYVETLANSYPYSGELLGSSNWQDVCNKYGIESGRLFWFNGPVTTQVTSNLVPSNTGWTHVSDSFGINSGKLYDINDSSRVARKDDSTTRVWTNLFSNYYRRGALKEYVYGIANGKLFSITKDTLGVTEITGSGIVDNKWTSVSGSSYDLSLNDDHIWSYGINDGKLYRLLGSTATLVDDTINWEKVTGYTSSRNNTYYCNYAMGMGTPISGGIKSAYLIGWKTYTQSAYEHIVNKINVPSGEPVVDITGGCSNNTEQDANDNYSWYTTLGSIATQHNIYSYYFDGLNEKIINVFTDTSFNINNKDVINIIGVQHGRLTVEPLINTDITINYSKYYFPDFFLNDNIYYCFGFKDGLYVNGSTAYGTYSNRTNTWYKSYGTANQKLVNLSDYNLHSNNATINDVISIVSTISNNINKYTDSLQYIERVYQFPSNTSYLDLSYISVNENNMIYTSNVNNGNVDTLAIGNVNRNNSLDELNNEETASTINLNYSYSGITEIETKITDSSPDSEEIQVEDITFHGLAIQYYAGRLWVGGTDEEGNGILVYSSVGLAGNPFDIYNDAGYIVNMYNDSSEVTALGLFSEFMTVHKKFNTYLLTCGGGKAEDSIELKPFSNITCQSQQSWIVSNTKYFVYSDDFNDIYPLVQHTVWNDRFLGEPISQKIRNLFKEIRQSDTRNIFCVSRPLERQMIFYMPTNNHPGSNYAVIYDFQTKSWLLRVVPQEVTIAFNYNNNVYIGTSDGKVLKEFTGKTFDGEIINAYYKSPWFDWIGGYMQSFAEFAIELDTSFDNDFYIRTQKDGQSRYEDRRIFNDLLYGNSLIWGGIDDENNTTTWDNDKWVKQAFDNIRMLLPNNVFEDFQIEIRTTELNQAFAIYGYRFRRIEAEESPW